MNRNCTHLDRIHPVDTLPSGGEECLALGRQDWVHLRVFQESVTSDAVINRREGTPRSTFSDPLILLYGPTSLEKIGTGAMSTN